MVGGIKPPHVANEARVGSNCGALRCRPIVTGIRLRGSHAGYSQKTGLLYAPVIEAAGLFKLKPGKFRESLPYWGGKAKVVGESWGAVRAFDPATGREAWSFRRSGLTENSGRSGEPLRQRQHSNDPPVRRRAIR